LLPQAKEIQQGDQLQVDPVSGLITNKTNDKIYKVEGIPEHLMQMIRVGGLMPWLKEKYSVSE
jgi:3-isopropylmalate/(R)-2-methylmalate dehydratase small subunit